MDGIPEPVRQFVAANIPTIDSLRILLLLLRARERTWTVEAVSGELRMATHSTLTHVVGLVARGLVAEVPGPVAAYRYGTQNRDQEALVLELDRLDHERPVTLINLVYGSRVGPAQAFADAFRLKQGD